MSFERFLIRQLAWQEIRIQQLEQGEIKLTSDQAHLDTDIADIDAKFSDAIQHLKDQIAAGTPAGLLDFSKADALVAKADAEDVADTPAAPAAPVAGVAPSETVQDAPATPDAPAADPGLPTS